MTAFICNTQKGKWNSTVNKDKTLCLLFIYFPISSINRHTPCRVSNSLFLTWTWWMSCIFIWTIEVPPNVRVCPGGCSHLRMYCTVSSHNRSLLRVAYFECETQNCSFSNSGQDWIKTPAASSPLLFYVQWSFLSSVGGYVPSPHECLKPWMIPNPLCVVFPVEAYLW